MMIEMLNARIKVANKYNDTFKDLIKNELPLKSGNAKIER